MMKRMLCMLMALVMLVSLCPMGAMAADDFHRKHNPCGEVSCTHEGHTADWARPLDEHLVERINDLPPIIPMGTFYLDEDLYLPKGAEITTYVEICLNGHTLSIGEGQNLYIEDDATLVLCDCQEYGQLARGPRENELFDSAIIHNDGTLEIYSGSYCLDGSGYCISNQNTARIYGGTYGICFINDGEMEIFDALIGGESIEKPQNAIRNSGTLTIQNGTVNGRNSCVNNSGSCTIQNGVFTISASSILNPACVENVGTMTIHDGQFRTEKGNAIHNYTKSDYSGSSYYPKLTIGKLYFQGGTAATTAENQAAIHNTGVLEVSDGTVDGYIGIDNYSSNLNGNNRYVSCTVSGGTVTGSHSGIVNGGMISTMSNGVQRLDFYSAELTIQGSPTISKIIVRHPDAMNVDYKGKASLPVFVDTEYMGNGDTVFWDTNILDGVLLLNEDYDLYWNYGYSKYDVQLKKLQDGEEKAGDIRWTLTEDGILTLTGEGKMRNIEWSYNQPWRKEKTAIEPVQLIIDPRITYIGTAAFSYLNGLTEIRFPEGVEELGAWCVEGNTQLEGLYLPASLKKINANLFTGFDKPIDNIQYAGCAHMWAKVEMPAQNPSFTPICAADEAEDDGDCTTAQLCSVCGTVTVEARGEHTGGKATCTELAKCNVCGKEYGDYGHVFDKEIANDKYLKRAGTCTASAVYYKSCACGKQGTETFVGPAPKGHVYDKEVEEARYLLSSASCTKGAVYSKSCACGAASPKDTFQGEPLGHKPVKGLAKAATCTESGLTAGERCSVCSVVITKQEIIPAKGHSFGDWTVVREATCTAEGKEERECASCSRTETRKPEKLPHKEGTPVKEHVVEVTCTADGSYESVVYCTVCKHELSRTKETVATPGHKDADQNYRCDTCGAKLCTDHQPTPIKGYAATCTTAGMTDGSKCGKCGETITAQTSIPAKGHSEVVDKGIPATCIEGGTTDGKSCSDCGLIIVKRTPVPAKGHSYGDWYTAEEATCTVPRIDRRDCENCNAFENQYVGSAQHSPAAPVKENEVSATCTAMGSYENAVYCTVCEAELSRSKHTVSALGHKDADGDFHCDTCGADLCTDHQPTPLMGTAPTCTADGLTEGSKCKNCGEIIMSQTVIPALGHQIVVDKAVAATCTAAGKTEGSHCSVCNVIIEEQLPIPAKGHSYGPWQVFKAPTGSEDGEERSMCEFCGDYKSRTLPKLTPTVTPKPTATPAPTVKPTPVVTAPPAPTAKPTPVVTATPAPTAKPTPVVTATPAPTAKPTPVVTATPAPTAKPTPVVTATPAPTAKPTPVVTATPTPTAKPTPVVTVTPAPTAKPTPVVTATPAPTAKPTPVVTATPAPTAKPTPVVTATPAPTAKPTPVVTPTPVPTTKPVVNVFIDVDVNIYYYAPVMWAVEHTITGGTGPNTFSPDNPCTRGQIVTFLWAANGRPEPKTTDNPFEDVSGNDYYYKAVLWAVENGITGGTSPTTFSPNAPCTRAQVATFLYAAKDRPAVSDKVVTFGDVASDAWYLQPVLWAAEQGITGGIGNGLFGPDQTCTRGQIVTFLYKAYETR